MNVQADPVREQAGPLVAIGVGNVLRTDDAVGVRVIEALRDAAERDPDVLPAGTRLVDGGTLGSDLLGEVFGTRGLVIVDAVRLGEPVGTVSVRAGEAIVSRVAPDGAGMAGPIGELLATARLTGWLPEAVCMVGIEIADTGPGLRLTPAVDRALPVAVAAVGGELRRMHEQVPVRSTGGGLAAATAGPTA